MATLFRERVPEPVRFATSGCIGSAAFWVLNEGAVAVLPSWTPQIVTVAWFLSYLLSIWLQHFLHSTLVYGWVTSYWKGLVATYAGYSGSLIASVPINAGLVNGVGLEAGQAWLATLIVTGVANYFLLSKLLGGPTKDAAKE
jgi:hypothetical protein